MVPGPPTIVGFVQELNRPLNAGLATGITFWLPNLTVTAGHDGRMLSAKLRRPTMVALVAVMVTGPVAQTGGTVINPNTSSGLLNAEIIAMICACTAGIIICRRTIHTSQDT